MNGTTGQPLTVSELNEYARKVLAGDPILRNLEVSGEISGYKHHYSGHRYFVLKDASARVQCVMFRQDAMNLDFTPADGMKITLRANASIFVRDGSYQLYVTSMRKSGLGDLYARFEQLKAKLAAEGLFDPARKREIPLLPKTIGIVTSQTGAAIRDMIRVARRRNPNVSIIVAPCAVQGSAAVPEIVQAIRKPNNHGECDVILVGRGGGSIEDLWAFNEEAVARAIAASKIPVISCVGHEIDFTIADFVADLRAPTPSAAAELAVPVLEDLNTSLDSLRIRLSHALSKGQQIRQAELNRLKSSLVFSDTDRVLFERQCELLIKTADRLERAVRSKVDNSRYRLNLTENLLRSLNPSSVVERGYAVVRRNGKIVPRACDLTIGDNIEIVMSGGVASACVNDVKAGNSNG